MVIYYKHMTTETIIKYLNIANNYIIKIENLDISF